MKLSIKSIVITCCALGFTSMFTQAQIKLIEKVDQGEGQVVIPFEKYELSNGLTLVIHEDHSDPIVHVDVTYHVGSAREEIGKSGFAHFFEHMMFQGSENVADEQHFKIISEAGGTLNGTTNRDRTNYFETMPRNQLEVALWLEADRMGFLLDAVTQKKFEVQRATVKNERGQRYDNRPYGLAGETVAKNLYPYGHPYSWLTIGYVEDLDRVDVNDLKNFFMRWYGPNNATLTVGGDVDVEEVKKLAIKYFGSIPRGPEVVDMKLPAPVIEKDRYVSMEDNVRFPLIQMVFPTVPRFHPDEPALDILADIFGGGKNSIFHKNFIKTQQAVNAQVNHPAFELAGEFTISVLPYPGKSLAETDSLIRASIAEFESRGVEDDDLQRVKASIESRVVNGLESVSGKVSQLASFQTFRGDPNGIGAELDRYNAVTKADVMRVYNKYIKGKHAVVLSVVPKGQLATVSKTDNYEVSKEGYKAGKNEYARLKYRKAVDDFDRSVKPEPGPAPSIKMPQYLKESYDNGLEVIVNESREIPVVNLLLTIKAGHLMEADDPSKAGIAMLTAGLLGESTQEYSAEEISNELDKLGSSISISPGAEEVTIFVNTLSKNFDKTLALLQEKLFNPAFKTEEFDRLKKEQLELIEYQYTLPGAVADMVYDKMLYGDGHIKAIPESGTVETVSSITLEDVKAFYKKYYVPNFAKLIVVGTVSADAASVSFSFLSNWPTGNVSMPKLPEPASQGQALFLVDQTGAAQSEIRIGYLAMPYDALGEYYKSNIMNYALGGAFNSRINLNLREDKGYTYGARSGFSGSDVIGPFTASASVRKDATDSSIVEFMKEITNYQTSGISDEELSFTKNSLMQVEALRYETSRQKAYFLKNILDHDLPDDYVKRRGRLLITMDKQEVNRLAQDHLPVDKMMMVVVGDKASIEPGLNALGYPVVVVDKKGNVLSEVEAPKKELPEAPAQGPDKKPVRKRKNLKKDY